jgi:hypothetical protein
VYSFTEVKPDSTELTKKDDEDEIPNYKNVSDEKRYKNLQKKLEVIHDYISIKEKGKCWAQELFKAYNFSEKTYATFFKSMTIAFFANYQYGWGIFADFVLDTECCEFINKESCQIVYNNFLFWLQELSEESGIPEDDSDSNNNNTKKSMSVTLPNLKSTLKNIRP